jgi:hypothetical protein
MTNQTLKQDVLELAAIAKECPDNLQEKCFELLLAGYLRPSTPAHGKCGDSDKSAAPVVTNTSSTARTTVPEVPDGGVSQSQNDLTLMDLHLKAKKFLEKSGLSVANLNQVLYKEGDDILPLYEDLKTTKSSESQIRAGLLQAMVSGIKSGAFEFNGEDVRKECQARKCYDGGNFATNFRNSATLFEGFEKYDSQNPTVRLSDEGRKSLAKAISELQ